MFTADDAASGNMDELDDRIAYAVRHNQCGYKRASIRIYIEDSFAHSIEYELERRGFKNIDAPSFVLKTDVEFSWD
jgi:hypothetical protein